MGDRLFRDTGLQEAFAMLYIVLQLSLKSLEERGHLGRGKQCRVGDAYDQGIKGMEFLPQ